MSRFTSACCFALLAGVIALDPASATAIGLVTATQRPPARTIAMNERYWQRAAATLRLRAAAALGVAPAGLAPMPQAAVAMRKSITSLSPAELASLRRGIAQMRAWNSAPRGSANFKRSLAYWANMHSFIGPSDDPVTCSRRSAINRPGMAGLSPQTPTTPDELATWCTCQHGTIQFLTWHRMYLFYFEQVLQAAAGDPGLRLPFWDYESDGHIPAAYRTATYTAGGPALPNPLYVASRQAGLASGAAALTPVVTSTAGAMNQGTYGAFDGALEQTPHGAVHCATGVQSCPSGYMGYVPTAGNDPIFYSHHANIDRLYECWLRVNQAARLPNDPQQLAQQFSFIDGSGALVTRRVGDMLTTAQLHYGYAAGGGCPMPGLKMTMQAARATQTIPLTGPVRLERGTTSVPLRLPDATRGTLLSATNALKGGALKGGAQSAGATPGPGGTATLVITGLAFDEVPQALYAVYLQGKDGRRVPVGVINFFNATAPHHDMPGMTGMAAAAPAETRLDATDALAQIGDAGDATLVFEPTTGVTGDTPALAARAISPAANVRFASARIEVR